MSSTFKKQLLLVLAGVFIGTLIYFGPKEKSVNDKDDEHQKATRYDPRERVEDKECSKLKK